MKKLTKPKRDTIITIDVGGDVDNFLEIMEINAPQSLLAEDMTRYFLARAITHISSRIQSFDVVNAVVDRVKSELQREFSEVNVEQEKRIIDAWLVLAESIRISIRQYLYEVDGRRNKIIATYRYYVGNGLVEIILCEDEDEV